MARLLRAKDISVWFSKQSAYNAVNATPAFTPLTRSSGKPKKNIGYVQDDTVTTDFNAQQNIQDTVELVAEIETSAAKQTITFMHAAIHGTETAYTNTATTYAALADGFTVTAGAYAALSVGDAFWVTGFAGSTINGFYIVSSKEASNKIVTTIAPAATESAGASVTLTSNKTKNADVTSYYTLQTRVTDNSAAGSVNYNTTYDYVLDTQSLTIGESGIVKSSLGFKGEQEVSGTAAISGQTNASAPTDTILSAVQNIVGFYVDGASYKCKQKSLTLNIGNGYQGDAAAACQTYYSRGAFTVGGDMAMRSHIDNPLDWKVKYEAATRFSVGVRISHSATEETYILIPRAIITEHNQDDSEGSSAAHQMSFAAEGDATTSATIIVYKNW